jgi:hypothetical protein
MIITTAVTTVKTTSRGGLLNDFLASGSEIYTFLFVKSLFSRPSFYLAIGIHMNMIKLKHNNNNNANNSNTKHILNILN